MCDSKKCTAEIPTPARRKFLRMTGSSALVASIGGLSTSGLAIAATDKAPPKPQNILSPDDALTRLSEGNARYVAGLTKRHDFAHEREALSAGQNPYAAVLSCADSRIAPEYAFDSARGDLFVVRVAGNFVNDDVLGSLEYAVAVLKVPVIVVLGHDRCGAVDAAVKVATKGAKYPGRIQSLADAILPSVDKIKGEATNLLDASITQNVRDSVFNLQAQSAIIRDAEKAGKLKIVGGVYRLHTGKVEIFG
ncbi:carbonic anhydrase [Pandoraea pulmonicola]|uniref:Carbonic anhydrase n=1 Tax=Pandoraea pulmonicola TaxID=93221 RepID=A0AAJ4ZBP8_PANPU|nr:carbonic anhydrase [Pandoraea pulmonicola]AJC21010.1 carbonic anhydrase [Pandoraea pulmonicola]SUA90369.1 Carbonic anhydrase [Pandoraea pulmonicola]